MHSYTCIPIHSCMHNTYKLIQSCIHTSICSYSHVLIHLYTEHPPENRSCLHSVDHSSDNRSTQIVDTPWAVKIWVLVGKNRGAEPDSQGRAILLGKNRSTQNVNTSWSAKTEARSPTARGGPSYSAKTAAHKSSTPPGQQKSRSWSVKTDVRARQPGEDNPTRQNRNSGAEALRRSGAGTLRRSGAEALRRSGAEALRRSGAEALRRWSAEALRR